MSKPETQRQLLMAAAACEDKKAEEISILELDRSSSAFTDYMLICSGNNPRQVQAIADEVELRLKKSGNYPNQVEGYNRAEWVLMDYVDFVLHIFSPGARRFYDLERLWRSAKRLTVEELSRVPERATEVEEMPATARSRKSRRPKASSLVQTALANPAKSHGKKKGSPGKPAAKKSRRKRES
jgi:ribosome-associated protein